MLTPAPELIPLCLTVLLVPPPAGITTNSFADPSARKVWMQHVFDVLVASKRAGKPLVGVMFWQATLSYRPDWDGYSTHIDYNRTNSTASTGRRMLHAGASMAGWRSLVPAFGDAEEEGLMSRIIALVTGQHGPAKRRRSLQVGSTVILCNLG
jgi:hypothetical protein